MTLDDKRSLWTVVKISQDTAKAEEQDRQKQARRALQFDQVSSRTESSSGSEESPDIVVRSPTCKGEDKTSEEEKKPTIAAVLPQLRTTPLASVAPSQRTTATVLPLFRFCEGDMSQDQTTVNSGSASVPSCSESNPVDVSQNQQVDSKFEDSHSPIRCVAQPSVRRHMRSSPDVEMKEFKKLNPKNNLSRLNSSSSPLSRLSDKEQDELQTVPQTERVTEVLKSEAPHRNSVMTSSDVPKLTLSSRKSVEHREQGTTSSSTVPVKSSKHSDQDALVSPVSNSQESFLVRRMQHSLRMSNDRKNDVKEKINDISEINEDCCEENNFDALKEQTEDMEKMTPGCSSVDNVPSSSSYSPSNEAKSKENCNNSRDTKKKVSEDRERNINAFDCDRSNYGRTLKARKAKRARLRLPFYIPPRKMDIHTYITYFKTSIKEQAVRLIEVS
ncbi:hypothetical protein L798_06298 [Zootermopsis nevadensis]|uniref:Uncharacterized protein n=2 Tax=Zootermopsis nevadensis TaxID=136037 RepID=A0A067RIY6_ZOONE|nr:hypothetical protein L798_06298 [Zootermopsis nevadensis]